MEPSAPPSPAPSHRYGVRLRLAYDGKSFAGWQEQAGQRTVQGTLAEAAARVCGHTVRVRGASRTDAGVHAEGQVAAFATERALPSRRWVLALNRYLPEDVSVWEAEPCGPDYEPRFDAVDKTYRYLFHIAAARDALLRNRVWHLGRHVRYDFPDPERMTYARARLDLDAMRAAAHSLLGTHDFRAFRAADDTRKNTVRTLSELSLIERFEGNPSLLALEVTGTAFMKNMVRILAGTLIDVGRGKLSLAQVRALLGPSGDRRLAGITAPAQGLTLLRMSLGRLRGPASH